MFLSTEPHQALPGLYISSAKTARDKQILCDLGITHVLTAAKGIYPPYVGEFNYMLLDVQDWMGEDLLYYFEEAIKFIDEGRKEGNVLVHCMAGVSRSASVVIAYIMHAEKVPFQVAYEKLKKARAIVHPNEAFKRQLEIFERWSLGVTPPSPPSLPNDSDNLSEKELDMWENSMCKLLFRLEFLAGFEKHGIRRVVSGEDPHVIFNQKNYSKLTSTFDRPSPTVHRIGEAAASSQEKTEEAIEYQESNEEQDDGFSFGNLDASEFSERKEECKRKAVAHTVWVWSCANCGRYLFTPLNIIALSTSTFEIEAMEWMREIGEEEGTLKCEKCEKEIGKYRWNERKGVGKQPPVPVFRIEKQNVQKNEIVIEV